MFGVACAALGRANPRQPAVKVTGSGEIGRNLLVTIEAQARLAVRVMAVVALEALFLVLPVRGADLAGHEHGLRIHGISRPCTGEEHEQTENRDGMTWTSPHESSGRVNRCWLRSRGRLRPRSGRKSEADAARARARRG